MTQAMSGIRGYHVLSELRHTCAAMSFRVRRVEEGDLLTLHLFPRDRSRNAETRALVADQARFADAGLPHLSRLRRIRADENYVVVEAERPDGETVDSLLARGVPVSLESALGWTEDLLTGLAAGAARGLHHGAIRPSCVIVDAANRASLDGFGFGALLPDSGDFYSRLAGDVPASIDRLHAKDVYTTVALLHHLVEGRPPFDAIEERGFRSKVLELRWLGARFRDIYDAVAPLGNADAAHVARRVRDARRSLQPAEPEAPRASSLLDAVDEPPPPPADLEERSWKARARRLAARPAAPVAAAGIAGALVALVFGAPFLGRDAGHLPTVKSAIALPAANPLPPADAVPPADAPVSNKTPPPERAPKRSETEAWRQMIIALAEIGDYPAALDDLKRSEGRPPATVREERDAVLAAARRRFDDLREVARALTAEGRLDDALREWDALKEYWPGPDLARLAAEERELLIKEAGTLREQKEKHDRLRAEQRMLAGLRKLGRRVLLEERYDFDAQLKEIDDFRAGLPKDATAPGNMIDACRDSVLRRREFFKRTQESVNRRSPPLVIARVSHRFGDGEIIGLDEGRLVVRRPDGTTDQFPLSRLDGMEKLRLFGHVPRGHDGAAAMATGLFCLSWGLREQAGEQFQTATGINRSLGKLIERVQLLAQEED